MLFCSSLKLVLCGPQMALWIKALTNKLEELNFTHETHGGGIEVTNSICPLISTHTQYQVHANTYPHIHKINKKYNLKSVDYIFFGQLVGIYFFIYCENRLHPRLDSSLRTSCLSLLCAMIRYGPACLS